MLSYTYGQIGQIINMKNNMNIFDKMDKDWESMKEAIKKTTKTTTEPDGVETELTELTLPEDNEDPYSDYVSEEMKSILGNRFN